MTKLTFSFLLLLAVALISGCGRKPQSTITSSSESEQPVLRVGMAVQDVENPTWIGYCEAIKREVEAHGGSMKYVSCDSDIEKQVEQVNAFIDDGVDVLIIHPTDPSGIEAACREAMNRGINVIAWDDNLRHADMRWLIDNHQLGYIVGEQASEWIDEKLGGKAQIAMVNYPDLPVLRSREGGIRDALSKLAPDSTIVAETSAINPEEGLAGMRTIFEEHPEVKVVVCIGGGGAVGADQAALEAGKVTDDFGIFAVDATPRELEAIKNDEGVRMSVTVTGDSQKVAETIYGFVEKLARGEPVPKEVYRKLIPVTKANVDEYYQPQPVAE